MALTTADAERLIIEFCGHFPVAASIKFAVRNTQEELYGPAGSKQLIGTILGGFHPREGRADFVTSAFTDEEHFLQVLRHEVLGHFGINTFSAADKQAVLIAVSEARAQPGLRELWGEIDRVYFDRSEMGRAEEVYAFVCEDVVSISDVEIVAGRCALEEVCLNRLRPMALDDLHNITAMVAAGLRDRARFQRTFPPDDSELSQSFQDPIPDGRFIGRIVAVAGGVAVQNVRPGAEPMHHLLRNLSQVVKVGDVVDITYRDGHGLVSGAQDRGRGR